MRFSPFLTWCIVTVATGQVLAGSWVPEPAYLDIPILDVHQTCRPPAANASEDDGAVEGDALLGAAGDVSSPVPERAEDRDHILRSHLLLFEALAEVEAQLLGDDRDGLSESR